MKERKEKINSAGRVRHLSDDARGILSLATETNRINDYLSKISEKKKRNIFLSLSLRIESVRIEMLTFSS